ncbi:MaoC/PaaZ C-terminal domain-containing protein [Lentisphaerota bacterium ZTH]|nr:MaoC family dehydratase [Lentisphaerota bacterium]WET05136.1 MaoC/PaaZ C-terminal domain-containing protein [Lentisphaerota bacterium ZTH]
MSFYGYTCVGENRYREVFGPDYEYFQEGMVFKHRPGVTLSQQDNHDEAMDTMNNAQLHYDANYASQTEWENCLGVSTLTLQLVLGATWKTFAHKFRIIRYRKIQMENPVFGGDTLYAESTVLEKKEHDDSPDVGLLTVETAGVNSSGVRVISVLYDILIYKSGRHPAYYDVDTAKEPRFLIYRQLNDGSLIEQTGLYYEQLNPGEIFEHRPGKTVTAEENLRHSLSSLDWNPRYTNYDYIEKYHAGVHYINENYLIGAATASTTRTFGRVVANLEWKNVLLPVPVKAGDTFYAESEIIFKRESKSRPNQGIICAATRAFNQDKKLIMSYERTFLIYKEGVGPYAAAGY